MTNTYSLIIPIYNEASNIKILYREILDYKIDSKLNSIIFVDDFSDDDSALIIEELKKKNKKIILLKNKKNFGQSYSIFLGVKSSIDKSIITIDGDLQNNPKDILNLMKIYESNIGISLVGGLRLNRKDSMVKLFTSRIANTIRKNILKDECSDTGCALKIFDREIFLKFPYFDGMHRFLPALFKGYGGSTMFVPVNHRPRVYGYSKYGTFKRLFKGIKDTYMIYKLLKRLKK